METTSDEVLMAAVRADNLDQLVPLFERYHGPLFNYLTRLTNDRETSEDLTQTVFERILKYRASYQPTQPFRAPRKARHRSARALRPRLSDAAAREWP